MGSAKAMSLPSGSVIMTVLTLSPDVRSLASMFSFPTAPPALPCWSQPGYPSRITEKSLGSFAHFQPITVSDDSSVVSLFRSKAPRFVRGWSLESIPQRLAVEYEIPKLASFGLAHKALLCYSLRYQPSGSNSVGRMPASPLPPLFSVIYIACCLPCCPLRCGSQERYCVASQHRQTHQD